MTERLRVRLAETADQVHASTRPLAETAWRSARRVRTRRRAVAAGAAAVLVGVVGLGVTQRLPLDAEPADPPTPNPVQTAPADPAMLPWAATALPRRIDLDHMTTLPLSTNPVNRALAVLQPLELDRVTPVLVLGDDGRFRSIDGVRLVANVDAGGNGDATLDKTALDPHGRRLVLLQPDHVLVVDLTTAAVRDIKLAGYNVGVRWDPSGSRLLVFREEDDNVWVDYATGTTTAAPPMSESMVFTDQDRAVDLVPAVHEDFRLVTPAQLREFVKGEPHDRPLSSMFGSWHRPSYVREGSLAAAGFTSRVDGTGFDIANPQAVVVLDARSGALRRLLAIDYNQTYPKGCCPVLGWLDDDTVLIAQSSERILSWNFRSGDIRRVTQMSAAAAIVLGDVRPG